MERARAILREYPDLRTAVSDVSAIGVSGQDSRTFQLSIQGPDIDKLAHFSAEFLTRLRAFSGLVDVDSTLSLRKPEVQVAIDRDRASDLGIPVQTIANSLNILVGGQIVSRYKEGTEQYDVWLRADKPFRADISQNLENLTIPSPTAGQVQLSSLATLTEGARAQSNRSLQSAANRDIAGASRWIVPERCDSTSSRDRQGTQSSTRIRSHIRRPGQDAGGNGLLLHGCSAAERAVYVPDSRRAI